MKKSKGWIMILSAFIFSCSGLLLGDDPSNKAVDTFEMFWKGVDETWPEFATKKVQWDSLHIVYRKQTDTVRSTDGLSRVLLGLLSNMKDQHTNIYKPDGTILGYYPLWPSYFYGYTWIKTHYLPGTVKGNNALAYGKINNDVVYMYIANFSGAPEQYDVIDNLIAEFKNYKGIIIDVRQNGGGNSSNSEKIASRFFGQTKTYGYSRYRTGPIRTAMSDYFSLEISPAGPAKFTGKVAVLTNRYSYSAAEDFILMMRASESVILMGDNTGGGSGTRPLIKELPNGWSYRVSSRLSCDANKNPITIGIVPDIKVFTTRGDSLKGKDTIIEAAVVAVMN